MCSSVLGLDGQVCSSPWRQPWSWWRGHNQCILLRLLLHWGSKEPWWSKPRYTQYFQSQCFNIFYTHGIADHCSSVCCLCLCIFQCQFSFVCQAILHVYRERFKHSQTVSSWQEENRRNGYTYRYYKANKSQWVVRHDGWWIIRGSFNLVSTASASMGQG